MEGTNRGAVLMSQTSDQLTNTDVSHLERGAGEMPQTLTFMQKYDIWAWKDGELKRTTKAANCIKGSGWACHDNCLFIFRSVVAVVYWGIWLKNGIHQFKYHGFFSLQYFTTWGVWLTTIYFTYAFITHLRYRNGRQF